MANESTSIGIRTGKPYLTDKESARVKQLADLRLIFEGKHKEYFYRGNRSQHVYKALGPNASNVLYITENLPGRCTLKFADLLFGEELVVEPADADQQTAEAIARISQASRLHPLLYNAATVASWAGKAYWQAVVRNGQVRLESVAPEHVFPRYDLGSDRLVGATIKFTVRIGDQQYVRVIDHAPGQITNSLWLLKKNSLSVESRAPLELAGSGLTEIQPTGIDELMIVEICNYSTGGVGASDYDGECLTLVDEVNNRRSQISRVLDKHADPAVQALESLFDEHGNLKASGRALAVDDMSKDAMKYITWQAQLADAGTALTDARGAFLGHMEIAPELLGRSAGTSADSWKKFKLVVTQTLARVNRKRIYMAPSIEDVFRIAFKLENIHTPGVTYPVLPTTLTWSDGLPIDDEDMMGVVTGYYSSGLMSRKRALTWMHSDKAIVEEELELIEAEAEASLPTALRGGMMGLAGNE